MGLARFGLPARGLAGPAAVALAAGVLGLPIGAGAHPAHAYAVEAGGRAPAVQELPSPEAPAGAAEAHTALVRNGRWVGLPFLFYTPETGFGGGALGGHYVRLGAGAEPSSALASLTVTSRGQLIAEALPELYLGDGSRAVGELRFSHYPDVFYGVGPNTPEEAEEDFTSRVIEAWAAAQRPVLTGLRAGIQARYRYEHVRSVEEGGLLAGGTILGYEGGTAVGVGVLTTWDTRDNIFSPRRGFYVEGSWLVHPGFLGSDFAFHRLVLDARRFVPVGGAVVLGFQAWMEAVPGDPPFSLLAQLGGASRMRGYREGRFRDRLLVAGQGELRFPIRGRIGGTAFVSAGDVAAHLGELDLGSLELAGGLGLRYRFTEEGVVLRADFAQGKEAGQLYLAIGQAF